jgi:hypothetical protein
MPNLILPKDCEEGCLVAKERNSSTIEKIIKVKRYVAGGKKHEILKRNMQEGCGMMFRVLGLVQSSCDVLGGNGMLVAGE